MKPIDSLEPNRPRPISELELFRPDLAERFRMKIPMYGSVSCGFPSPAEDYLDKNLSLDEHLIKNRAATHFVRAAGDSMVGAGIFENSIVIIDRSRTARSNNIVLAILNGEFTIKRYVRNEFHHFLYPDNPKYRPIALTEEMEFEIWGVAIFNVNELLK